MMKIRRISKKAHKRQLMVHEFVPSGRRFRLRPKGGNSESTRSSDSRRDFSRFRARNEASGDAGPAATKSLLRQARSQDGGPSALQFDFKDPNKEVSPQISYDKFDPDSPASYRRGIYRFVFRNINDPLLETFDAVDPSMSMAKRQHHDHDVASLGPVQQPLRPAPVRTPGRAAGTRGKRHADAHRPRLPPDDGPPADARRVGVADRLRESTWVGECVPGAAQL
jgi:hypothetical protein